MVDVQVALRNRHVVGIAHFAAAAEHESRTADLAPVASADRTGPTAPLAIDTPAYVQSRATRNQCRLGGEDRPGEPVTGEVACKSAGRVGLVGDGGGCNYARPAERHSALVAAVWYFFG